MSTASTKGGAYWRQHARRYDRATLLLNRSFARMARRAGEEVSGLCEVLEIAAGTGMVTVEIAPRVGHLVATDRSGQMLDVLKERLAEAGVSSVSVQEADAMALPFGDSSFDAVVAANLLHLLPDPAAALVGMRRVLRPGGRLMVPTFCHGETAISRAVSFVLALSGFPIVTRFAGAQLRRLVEGAGFVEIEEAVFPGALPLRWVAARRS